MSGLDELGGSCIPPSWSLTASTSSLLLDVALPRRRRRSLFSTPGPHEPGYNFCLAHLVRYLAAAALALTMICCSGAPVSGGSMALGILHEDSAEAIEACRVALALSQEAGASEQHEIVANGCAPLLSLGLCREAVRMSILAAPALRSTVIALPCQLAYCDLLPEPRPALCELEVAGDPGAVASAWPVFVSAILELELGLDVESQRHMILTRGLASLVTAPEALTGSAEALTGSAEALTGSAEALTGSAPSRRFVVRIGRQGGDHVVGARLGDGRFFGPWTLPLTPETGDLSGLLEAAMREADGCSAAIEVTPGVTRSVVAHLHDALREGGLTDVLTRLIDQSE